MLSERITAIFRVLDCNNSDIAACANCSSSYIRLIHSDKRAYSPKDKPIALLATGIYIYAEKEHLLQELTKICNASGNSRENLIPSIVTWLFDTDKKSLPPMNTVSVRKKREAKTRSFGEKLNSLMEVLELSNTRLARSINIDDSYISRFRNGLRYPMQGSEIARLLAETLYKRVVEQKHTVELAKISGIPVSFFQDQEDGIQRFSSWLYENSNKSDVLAIDRLLQCIDSFSPKLKMPFPELKSFVTEEVLNSKKELYEGIGGLREAVIRFLGNTEAQGGELWLYSDEDINWMVGDPIFFSKWYALMLACVKRGVRVKIIHNINRDADEMISAIQSWMPLYMSGMIEPYVCHKASNARFSHTIFLRPEAECVFAFHVRGVEKGGCYDYLTGKQRLSIIASEFNYLVTQSESLTQIHIGDGSKLFYSSETSGKTCAMLSSLSLGTLSKELLASILKKRNINGVHEIEILEFCQKQREIFEQNLQNGSVYEFIQMPDDYELFDNRTRLNLAPSLYSDEIFYTIEEYSEHIRAIADLIEKSTAYHLYVMPELPFSDIQIMLSEKRVIVIRSSAPCVAFTFTEPMIIRAFEDYFHMLMKQYECDRCTVLQMLNHFL